MNRNKRLQYKKDKMTRIKSHIKNKKFIDLHDLPLVLESLIAPYERVIIEGDNQKQACELLTALNQVNPKKVHNLSIVSSSIIEPSELELFTNKIAHSLDFSFAGPLSSQLSQMINENKIKINSINTYLELYGRLFVDLIPDIALVCGVQADPAGNLYLAENTEETPIIVEATHSKSGIVIAQVDQINPTLPRIDIPNDQIDLIVVTQKNSKNIPLFTKNPKNITNEQILAGMLAIKGIYARYNVKTLNHGVGYNTAAIELLLPTYGAKLGLKGKIATHWVNNATPTLIPAIEAGWVKSIYCFGGEAGMHEYIANHRDIFAVDQHGYLRSNRIYAQIAGQYAIDMFVGSALETDAYGNASTITPSRLSGFGGAPNMGSDPHGRRHLSDTYKQINQGQKLVVQIATTHRWNHQPVFVDKLSAKQIQNHMDIDPIMIYSNDTTHIVTEKGIANLYRTDSPNEKRLAIAAISGNHTCSTKDIQRLKTRNILQTPADLNIDPKQATRDLLAAQTMDDLVKCSHGLYHPQK